MRVVWLAVLLLLIPGIAAGQPTATQETQPPPPTQPPTQPETQPESQPEIPPPTVVPQPPAATAPEPGAPTTSPSAPAVPPEITPPPPTPPRPTRRAAPAVPQLPTPAPPATPIEVPGIVIGPSPPGTFPTDISPRTPPPPTIPSGPRVILPTALPAGLRPTRLFTFHPSVGLSEEYSDNFTRAQNAGSNYRSTISPGLQVLLDYGTVTGSAAYNLAAFYDSSSKEYGFHNRLAGLLAWQAMPTLRLTLAEAFFQSDDPAEVDRLDLSRDRREFTSNQSSLTSDYAVLGLDTKQYYRFSDFSSDDSTTRTHRFGLSASRHLSPIHVFSGGYEYLISDTTNTVRTTQAGISSSLTGHQITASLSRDISALMTAGLSAVYAMREQESGARRTTFDRWGVTLFNNYVLTEKLVVRGTIGVAQLSTTDDLLVTSTSNISYWLGPATFTLGIERGSSETFGEGQNFGVVQTSGVFASVLYRFTPLLSAQLTGSYRENEFTGVGGGTTGQNDKTYAAGLNVTYQVARWLTVTLNATHTESEGVGRSFTENRVRAALNAILY